MIEELYCRIYLSKLLIEYISKKVNIQIVSVLFKIKAIQGKKRIAITRRRVEGVNFLNFIKL
jgi:hypothetical protein